MFLGENKMIGKVILTNCLLFSINIIPNITLQNQLSFVAMKQIGYLQQGEVSSRAQLPKSIDNEPKPGGDEPKPGGDGQ